MSDQVLDRREIGIPADVELIRHETELMADSARGSMEEAAFRAEAAEASRAAAAAHAADARDAAAEAQMWRASTTRASTSAPASQRRNGTA